MSVNTAQMLIMDNHVSKHRHIFDNQQGDSDMTILYLTDFYYEAKGRKYYEEDLFLTSKLKEHFNILIGHPHQVLSYVDCADIIVFRNTGPVMGYKHYFAEFLRFVQQHKIKIFNSFDGKADIQGKQYLLDLFGAGFPVIPTVEAVKDIDKLGQMDKFIVKLRDSADSIGMEILSNEELLTANPQNKLIQPHIDFQYEVSFYYLNRDFQYALYAPDTTKRWQLTDYQPTPKDLDFAQKFISWNNIEHGITRVDACRLADGNLLLMELEDLNPYLSLDVLSEDKRNDFVANFIKTLKGIA